MIRIPGVQETAPSTVSLQAPLGQQVQQNEGLEMLGQTASMTGRQATRFAALGQQGMRNARVSKAKEGQTRAAQKIKELLEDRENGYLLKKGAAARDGIGDLEKALDAEYKKIAGAFDDDETRKMFEEAVALDFTRAKTAAGIHWSKQSQVANAAQSKVRYGQHADDIAAGGWGAKTDLRDEVEEYGKLVGLSPEQREQLFKDTLSSSEATFIGVLLDEGDLDGASEEIDKHGDSVDRPTLATLKKRLRTEQQAASRLDVVKKRNEKAQGAVFSILDSTRFGGADPDRPLNPNPGRQRYPNLPETDAKGAPLLDTAERHALAEDKLEEMRRDNIKDSTKGLSAEEYTAARTFLTSQMQRERTEEARLVAADADVMSRAFLQPGMTLDQFRAQHPDEARRLEASSEGRDLVFKVGTAEGKNELENIYKGLCVADDSKDLAGIKARFPLDDAGQPTNIEQLKLLETDKMRKALAIIRKAHGLDLEPNDEGRLKGTELLNQKLRSYPWAHLDGDIDEGMNGLVIDDLQREMNRALPPDASADDQRNWIESQLREGVYRDAEGHVVPRAVLRSLGQGEGGASLEGITGLTTAGALNPADLLPAVRQQMVRFARAGHPDKSNRQIARRAEALWLQLGSPTTVEQARQAHTEYKGGKRQSSNLHKGEVRKMLSDSGDAVAITLAGVDDEIARRTRAIDIATLRLEAEFGEGQATPERVEVETNRLLRGAEAYRNARPEPTTMGSPVTSERVSPAQQRLISESTGPMGT
jgi:hypothetical protein